MDKDGLASKEGGTKDQVMNNINVMHRDHKKTFQFIKINNLYVCYNTYGPAVPTEPTSNIHRINK